VYADFPQNSSLRPTYMVSMPTYEVLAEGPAYRDNWTSIQFDNFVLLKKGADPELVNAKIKDAFKNVKDYEKSFPYLHPLSKHHISPNSQPDMLVGLAILSLATILVLVLSCVNYVNLSLANSTQRSTEIGIKKVIGSSKKLIARQFIAETVLHHFLPLFWPLFVTQAALPLMNRILERISIFRFGVTAGSWFSFFGQPVVGVLSGLYPATSFQPTIREGIERPNCSATEEIRST
jgi:putative ABC transport system permease protein